MGNLVPVGGEEHRITGFDFARIGPCRYNIADVLAVVRVERKIDSAGRNPSRLCTADNYNVVQRMDLQPINPMFHNAVMVLITIATWVEV